MITLKNLKIYFNKADLIFFLYFAFIFVLPPLLGANIKLIENYHILNIFTASIIFFYGFIFKNKNYYKTILIIFLLIFLITISSDYFNYRSLVFFYYFFVMLFASVIIIEHFSVKKIINLYCGICYLLSIYAVYEYINPFEQFEIGILEENRANSIFREPSHFAITIIPSLAYFLNNLKKYWLQIIVVTTSLIITFSITAYILCSILLLIYFLYFLKNLNRNYFLLLIPIIIGLTIILINLDLNKFTSRYNLQLVDFLNLNIINYNKNLTLWSVITTLKVNIFTLLNYPFGIGLGNFSSAYYDVISKFLYDYNFLYGPNHDIYASEPIYWFSKTLGFNDNGHSLPFRLFSELGLLSLIFFFLFFYSFFSSFNQNQDLFSINLVILFFLIGKFFKISSYFLFGTPIFLALFLYLNIKSIMKKKINKKLFYLPVVFITVFSISFFVLKKINSEIIYNVKLYTNFHTSEYLLSVNNLIQNRFKDLKITLFDINYQNKNAFLNLKYLSKKEIEKNKIRNLLNNEFENFKLKSISNKGFDVKTSEEFFRNELVYSSKPFWSDLDASFFISNSFLPHDNERLPKEEIDRIKNKFLKKAGIKDLDFIDNLNNKYPEDQPKENLQAKKTVLIRNLLKSQQTYNSDQRHPSWILSILINFYSNPEFRNTYSSSDATPKIYRILIDEEKFPINLNIYLISILNSLFFSLFFFRYDKNINN